MLFITQDNADKPYIVGSLGNWFKDRCKEADVPGSLHGLRKAGATRLANVGDTPDEIKAFLAHATNGQGATYTKTADRAKQADRGFAKLENVSNLSEPLDRKGKKDV